MSISPIHPNSKHKDEKSMLYVYIQALNRPILKEIEND